jgi:hypothetical protein
MRPVARWLALALVTILVVAACASTDRPSVQADTVVLPTPLQSFDRSLSATIEELEVAVAALDRRIAVEQRPYRPSEPQSLLLMPRAVLRADLADPDDGFVVVYDTADAREAAVQGRELADYLGSGFGQTNFAVDTQFSVRTVGDTIVFTTWSRRRSSDPDQAEAVFDVIATVGEEIEVLK